jgi:hypothetical protein
MDWAKRTNQSMVLLKLDFGKAYDEVIWKFLFLVLERMGMDCKFTNMVQVLFNNAKTYVCLNGNITKPFKLDQGIR